MPRDRSLDEFLAAGSDADGDESEEGDAEPPASAEPEEVVEAEPETVPEQAAAAEADVEPKATTYGWSPDGGECAACGDAVGSRWRDDGDLVCTNCKDW